MMRVVYQGLGIEGARSSSAFRQDAADHALDVRAHALATSL